MGFRCPTDFGAKLKLMIWIKVSTIQGVWMGHELVPQKTVGGGQVTIVRSEDNFIRFKELPIE